MYRDAFDFDDKSLYILFFNHGEDTSFYVLYRYDLQSKTFYGEQPLEYMQEHFLSHYFAWRDVAGEEEPFSAEDLGDYTFVLQEVVNYN